MSIWNRSRNPLGRFVNICKVLWDQAASCWARGEEGPVTNVMPIPFLKRLPGNNFVAVCTVTKCSLQLSAALNAMRSQRHGQILTLLSALLQESSSHFQAPCVSPVAVNRKSRKSYAHQGQPPFTSANISNRFADGGRVQGWEIGMLRGKGTIT